MGLLIVGVAIFVVALYLVLVFVKQVGDVFLATLRSGQRTAEYNEQIAANLAGAKVGDKLASLAGELQLVLHETTQTLQAVRPAIAETEATTRTARLAIAETAATAKGRPHGHRGGQAARCRSAGASDQRAARADDHARR